VKLRLYIAYAVVLSLLMVAAILGEGPIGPK
jgi:hypothetical protein